MSPLNLDFVLLALAVIAAAFTYFKFFREGQHRQRIQFDLDCRDLGAFGDYRIIEIGCIAENRGNVEQRFDDIRVTIRGIKAGDALKEIAGHEPRLAFPTLHEHVSLLASQDDAETPSPTEADPYFVRPGVAQRFPLLLRILPDYTHLHVRSTFKYHGTKDVHSAERAFSLVELKPELG